MEMDYNCLTCNSKDCFKELTDQAYVTFCSHIFCVGHGKRKSTEFPAKLLFSIYEGEKMRSDLPAGCLACKELLMDHQIMETNLNASKIGVKLLLAGHNPKTILAAADSALSFWNYQKKHEYLDMQRHLERYR